MHCSRCGKALKVKDSINLGCVIGFVFCQQHILSEADHKKAYGKYHDMIKNEPINICMECTIDAFMLRDSHIKK